jgi:hypothetical protein
MINRLATSHLLRFGEQRPSPRQAGIARQGALQTAAICVAAGCGSVAVGTLVAPLLMPLWDGVTQSLTQTPALPSATTPSPAPIAPVVVVNPSQSPRPVVAVTPSPTPVAPRVIATPSPKVLATPVAPVNPACMGRDSKALGWLQRQGVCPIPELPSTAKR